MTREDMVKAIKLSKEFSTLYLNGVVDMSPTMNDKAEIIPRVHIHIKDFMELYGDREFQYKDRNESFMRAEIVDDGVSVFALVDRYEYPERTKE